MSNITQSQLAELELIREESGGVLPPDKVLEFARSSNTALYSAFVWDDTEAGEKWRLHQAKQLIRAAVTMLPRPDGGLVPVRAYVFDARQAAYRATAAVVSDAESAESLLRQMRLDIERAVGQYRRYAELAPAIAAALGALDAAGQT